VILPQFTLDRGKVTVRVAATAAQELTLTVPRPTAAPGSLYNITIARGARNGGSSVFQLAWGAGVHIWISPTARKPTVGTLSFFVQAILPSPPHVSPSYDYNLDIPGPPGIIPRPVFHVTAASLATVAERFYQDVPSLGALSVTGWNQALPGNAQPLGEVLGHHMPQAPTEYFSTSRGLLWQAFAHTECQGLVAPCFGGQGDDWRAFTAGQHVTEEWNRYPLHPAPNTALSGRLPVSPVRPSAARIGNRLLLDWTPFSDNQAGHLGLGFGDVGVPETGSYAVYQDGVQIAHGSAVNGIPAVGLTAKPSTIRFVLTASRRNRLFPLSPSSQTAWTWRSAPDPAARVPAGWYCPGNPVRHTSQPVRKCAVQALMTLNYQVQGLSLSGLTKPGPQVIELTAEHIPLAKTTGITRATAQVSFNDGHTWRPAAVAAQGRGRFKITFTAPAGAGVTTRVSATDAAGGSITETIQNGYGVSP